jgi:hypothetical protein
VPAGLPSLECLQPRTCPNSPCHAAAAPCRVAQEEGEFGEAFFLCAQCIRSMEELGQGLAVAQQVRLAVAPTLKALCLK